MTVTAWPEHRLSIEDPAGWRRHDYPGHLIVIEGVDGAGRSTQIDLLELWLKMQGYGVLRSDWNSSKLVAKTIRDARRQQSLTPLTYSVLHATDVAARQESEIIPALKAGFIVLADRYVFTAFARDTARGVDRDWIYNLYSFALRPDLAVYLRVSTDLSLERIRGMAGEVSLEEADESASVRGALDSFREFQEHVIGEYDGLVAPFGLVAIDSSQALRTVQQQIRKSVAELLEGDVL
jgi:dTMP kinase